MASNSAVDGIKSLLCASNRLADRFERSRYQSDMQNPESINDCCHRSSMIESPSDPPVLSTESPTAPPHWARYLLPCPTEETSSSPTQSSLFTQLDTHPCIVENRARTRPPTSFAGTLPPNCDDYELALAIKPQVTKHFVKDRRAWLRKERALLESDRRAGARVAGASIARALKPPSTRPDKPRRLALRISAPARQDQNFTPLPDYSLPVGLAGRSNQ